MKPSDKQLAAGTLAFNSCKSVVIPDCISAAYDAMTEAMTVENVRAWAKGKGIAVVPLDIIAKFFVPMGYALVTEEYLQDVLKLCDRLDEYECK